MRKIVIFALSALAILGACSKTDPILPGTREAIFPGNALIAKNKTIPDLAPNASPRETQDCPYTQDSSNIVWDGTKKIFSGYPTSNSVKSNQKPVCSGSYVYIGLTTGELVKIKTSTRNIEWIADIYRQSNLTGGATVLDILVPMIIDDNSVYAGGLGDAFCKLRTSDGKKLWCLDIGVAVPFLIVDKVAFIVGTSNTAYAVNAVNGDIYWVTKVRSQSAPKYAGKILTVGNQKINAVNGELIK
jgi:outer membrane protein assembly factor BamB